MNNLVNKADSRLNRKMLNNCLNYLEQTLSKEGYSILIKWLEGASNGGWNRWQTLITLASFFGYYKYSKTRPHYLLKSNLVSYTNRDLLGLIETDLVVVDGKLFQAGIKCIVEQ